MTDIDRLYSDFAERLRAGEDPDPWKYVTQVEGLDRAELTALIDGLILRQPPREWDAAAFEGSLAERVVQSIDLGEWATAEPAAEGWATLLPRLRDRSRLTRAAVVERLAESLGVREGQEKVGLYYHRMEHEELGPESVSARVLEALGSIVGESAETIRSAWAPGLAPPASPGPSGVFARSYDLPGDADDADLGRARRMTTPAGDDLPARSEWDEVDELFLGGGS